MKGQPRKDKSKKRAIVALLIATLALSVSCAPQPNAEGAKETPSPAVPMSSQETDTYQFTQQTQITPTPLPLPTFTPVPTELAKTALQLKKEGKENAIPAVMEQLALVEPALAEQLSRVFDYWDKTQQEGFVRHNGLPDDLPNDGSLCIVALGYRLNEDGTMKPELIGRLKVLLAAAQQYPNAYILVAGGGTASEKLPEVTEAGGMAQWLTDQGVDGARIIVEKSSLSTYENILFSTKILIEEYPAVTGIAIVTSDYHIPRGSLFFTSYFIKNDIPLTVLSNAAFSTDKEDTESGDVLGGGVGRIFGLS